jgi:hypothetical protein
MKSPQNIFCSLVTLLVLFLSELSTATEPTERNVFELPVILARHAQLQRASMIELQKREYDKATELLEQAIEAFPDDPTDHYNLACALARQGQLDEAIASLSTAVAKGFNSASQMKQDDDLADLRDDPKFDELLEAAKTAKPVQLKQTIKPEPVVDGQALVTESNTAWDGRSGVFRTFFAPSQDGKTPDEIGGKGDVHQLLNEWFSAETAAGNYGDFYDNHDNDHSKFGRSKFPQIVHIRYDEAAKKLGLHTGLQNRFFFNTVTFGNSSTAVTGKAWRSQTRMAYTQPQGPAVLYAQYRLFNHLYVYPEHRDHDPGHNGKGGGYGDVYCANTPYVITSQGSSGSDQPFLNAIALTLAAFQPKTKQLLTERRALMPTLQMIFRRCNQPVRSDEDYLSGIAHPSAFDGKKLDVMKMVNLAHQIPHDKTPPLVQLRVIEEDEAEVGKDYFDIGQREKLFDTPAAIARVYRTLKQSRRMVVSAVESSDLNDRQLTWHWRVLRGNADKITIKSLNPDSSKVELTIPYHERQPIWPGSDMESNRVDIGVFVHNGTYYSAPGFISLFFLDNEQREYNERGQIKSVQYSTRAAGGNYVDPFIDVPKNWRDDYHYDANGKLTYWSRHRGDAVEWFTPDGSLVTKWDNQRRPAEAVRVRYVAESTKNNPPTLRQERTEEIVTLNN